jgi:hypothetical protein
VEAAIAVQMMLASKGESARQYLEPQIREITLELLKIIRETENDDLTNVMQKIVCTYTEQLVPVAVDICQHLVGTFAQVGNRLPFTNPVQFMPISFYEFPPILCGCWRLADSVDGKPCDKTIPVRHCSGRARFWHRWDTRSISNCIRIKLKRREQDPDSNKNLTDLDKWR